MDEMTTHILRWLVKGLESITKDTVPQVTQTNWIKKKWLRVNVSINKNVLRDHLFNSLYNLSRGLLISLKTENNTIISVIFSTLVLRCNRPYKYREQFSVSRMDG